MAVDSPGENVLELIHNATDRIVIVAPYIKSRTIRRLLEAVPESVLECICVTRWLPEDIASGVCDLEIFDDINQVKGGRLLVHSRLHAKYYSNGRQSLVGSANLTARGFGWHTLPNVELLVAVPANLTGLAAWEQSLLSSAIKVTEQLRQQIRVQAEQLGQAGPIRHAPEVEESTKEVECPTFWVPQCPVPNRLWEVYQGRGEDRMVSSTLEAAREDLATLSLPPGLTQDLFGAYVARILRQTPLLTEIDRLAGAGLTDTEAYEFLAERLVGESDYKQIWHIVKKWLRFFFPDSYDLEVGEEILVKDRKSLT